MCTLRIFVRCAVPKVAQTTPYAGGQNVLLNRFGKWGILQPLNIVSVTLPQRVISAPRHFDEF